jgi:hypothetical protein
MLEDVVWMSQSRFGFLFEPGSEGETCLLFGCLMPYIGEELEKLGFTASEIYVDEWTEKPTDIVLQVDGRRLRVEFELFSSNFLSHGHKIEECDLIACWKNDWDNAPVRILELSKMVEERFPQLIVEKRPKHPERVKPWSLEEYLEKAREKISDDKFRELSDFIEEIRSVQGVELKLGRGDKIPTLGIYFRKLNAALIGVEATSGKAYIAYFNVNVKPPKPLMPEEKIREIRRLLNEPEKLWHNISASNTSELLGKIREIIKIILKE